jgi:predicted Zn-dependent protease
MPPTLEVFVYDRLPGRWGEDAFTRGLLAYAAGKHDQAADLWQRAIKSNPRRYAWLRYSRAGLLAQTQRWDDAIAELDTLATELQRRDSTLPSSSIYASREIVYHALGMLHLVRDDGAAARAALGQALTENLGYAPAHAALGEAALAARNSAEAITELSQAVELAPHDVWYRHRLGVALLAARRADSARVVLEDVSRREPLFADAYFDLGRAKEMKGDAAGAGAAYEAYLARAPARDAERIEWVRGRLAGLPR